MWDSPAGRWCRAGFRRPSAGRGIPRLDPLPTPSQSPPFSAPKGAPFPQDSWSLSSSDLASRAEPAEQRWPDPVGLVTKGRPEIGARRRADIAASTPKRQASSGRQRQARSLTGDAAEFSHLRRRTKRRVRWGNVDRREGPTGGAFVAVPVALVDTTPMRTAAHLPSCEVAIQLAAGSDAACVLLPSPRSSLVRSVVADPFRAMEQAVPPRRCFCWSPSSGRPGSRPLDGRINGRRPDMCLWSREGS
jgi:hypothetical protein